MIQFTDKNASKFFRDGTQTFLGKNEMKVTGIILSLFGISLLFSACNDSEPVATQYKKEQAANAAGGGAPDSGDVGGDEGGEEGEGGDEGGDEIDPALVEAGVAFYNDNGCGPCHNGSAVGPELFGTTWAAADVTTNYDLAGTPQPHSVAFDEAVAEQLAAAFTVEGPQ